MSQSVNVEINISCVLTLLEGLEELKLAHRDLRNLEREKRRLKNCQGKIVEVDYEIQNELGDKIGVIQNAEGRVEFVTEKDGPTVKATIDKISQAYSRIKILNEVKKKGYKSVKEEKLANGSIRIVVEKWR